VKKLGISPVEPFMNRFLKVWDGNNPRGIPGLKFIDGLDWHEKHMAWMEANNRSEADKQKYRDCRARELQKIGEVVARAIIDGKSQWFRDIATYLEHREDGPADPARFRFLSYISQHIVIPPEYPGWERDKDGVRIETTDPARFYPYTGIIRCKKTRNDIQRFFESKGITVTFRQIHRWCKELGIQLRKDKAGRRKGSRNLWGGK